MNPNTAIQIQNLSKQYRLGLVGTGTLSHDLKRWWTTNVQGKEDPYLKVGEVNDRASKGTSDYVWALKDINLEIAQGDVVGIIGKNGAGKSTLLKLLSRVTKPTTGTIAYRGRIASLLEIGTGFHPEMTGRENIYMNGAIMGMTRHEINRKLDEIIAFAGVERYIDTPVKRYSSGMKVRLGFAVAAHLEPDILVVDEVLAVGDAEFQKKAIGKMQDVSREGGRTVLFVSHNMGAVRNLCNKGIVMNDGFATNTFPVEDAIEHYLTGHETVGNVLTYVTERSVNDLMIFIKNARIIKSNNSDILRSGDLLELQVRYQSKLKESHGDLHIGIYDAYGDKISHVAASFATGASISFKNEGVIICKFPRLPLVPGRYIINLSLHLSGSPHHRVINAFSFLIEPGDFFKNGKLPSTKDAKILLDSEWETN